jgi:HAE1 family hydrophobic/amphiphilic exporter-1
MMTMISTVLGSVPLLLAFGAGAEARVALGWVIVGGLGLAMIATLFLTPVAYLLLARFRHALAKQASWRKSFRPAKPAEKHPRPDGDRLPWPSREGPVRK